MAQKDAGSRRWTEKINPVVIKGSVVRLTLPHDAEAMHGGNVRTMHGGESKPDLIDRDEIAVEFLDLLHHLVLVRLCQRLQKVRPEDVGEKQMILLELRIVKLFHQRAHVLGRGEEVCP